MRACLAVLLCLMPLAVRAEGFALRDLSPIATQVSEALGAGFEMRAAPERVTLTCPACEGAPVVDIVLGRQNDGTEERVRSGQTSIAKLEALCQARNPACRVSGLSIAPAVEWVSSYPMGSMAGSTAIILRGGDLLTIRSLATSPRVAALNAQKVARIAVLHVVGR